MLTARELGIFLARLLPETQRRGGQELLNHFFGWAPWGSILLVHPVRSGAPSLFYLSRAPVEGWAGLKKASPEPGSRMGLRKRGSLAQVKLADLLGPGF